MSLNVSNNDPHQIGPIEQWERTLELRWVVVGRKKRLEQRWFERLTGKERWEEVPTVKLDE